MARLAPCCKSLTPLRLITRISLWTDDQALPYTELSLNASWAPPLLSRVLPSLLHPNLPLH